MFETIIQLPRSNKACPKCKNEDAVFFQSQQRSAETGMVCQLAAPLIYKHIDINWSLETFLRLLWLRVYLSVKLFGLQRCIGVGSQGFWRVYLWLRACLLTIDWWAFVGRSVILPKKFEGHLLKVHIKLRP